MRPTTPHHRFTPAPLTLAAAMAIALAASHAPEAHAQAGAAAAATLSVNIPAQPLGQALNELARQANLQMTYPAALVAGKRAPAVSGQLTTGQALARLLAGSELESAVDGHSVVIKPAATTPQHDAELPAVKVTAASNRSLSARQEQGFRARSSSVSGFREQEVLNTPFSTATISAEVMESQQAKSLVEVLKNDPSVTPASDPLWFDRVNIRGFNVSVNAVYRDGMSINDQGSIALENKAAIELNKGLSALRYGATSPGGTVNYVVKRPTNEPLRKVSVTADSHGSLGTQADLGGRFGPTQEFGYRINAAAEKLRSHVDAFKGDKRFVSGFFDWRVNHDLTLELDIEHQRMDKLSVRTPALWWFGSTEAAREAYPRLRPDTYSYQSWAMEPNRQTYLAARAHYQITDDWKATFAVQDSRLKRDQNSSGVWDTVAANGDHEADIYYSPDQERNNRALQLVVQGDTRLWATRHELAFGYDQVQRDMTYPEGVNVAIGVDNIYNDRDLPRPAVTAADAGPSYLANRSQQRSWFVTDNVVLSEQWRVFGGLRHTDVRQFGADSATDPLTKRYDRNATNPTVGLIYKPVPAGTLYVSYAEGIEQGGTVNGPNYTNDGAQLAPLESQQREVGVKWELGRNALVTAALFEIDKGLETDRNNGNGTRTRVQDGRQLHRGVEFTATGQLTSRLKVIAGMAYLDAKVKKTSDAALLGKKPQGVPDWQANLYADYAVPQWLEGLSFNAGVYHGGKKAIDSANTWMADSYIRLDAGIKYTQRLSGGQDAVYRLNIDNLTDKRYLASTTSGSLQFGVPRTVRFSASLGF